ncbi:MAG: PAS domain-containing protein [Proteobacteria bacterium]|nr:PAS domain-containing protein [Pseudomonadota bacterium]
MQDINPPRADGQNQGDTEQDSLPPIIGVGSSAGGLEAFTQLLEHLPADFHGTLVFLPHLMINRESELVRIFTPLVKFPVSEIIDKEIPAARHLYVLPGYADVILAEGKFKLRVRNSDRLPHKPIDLFLNSLANEIKSRAIGVILSGTGNDGAEGLSAIKLAGGVCLVQSEESAKFPEMPRAAELACEGADFVLAPEKIALELDQLCRKPIHWQLSSQPEFAFNEMSLNKLFHALNKLTGADFSSYKFGTVGRRILRRMVLLKVNSLEEYIDYIELNQKEALQLFNDILINVTNFFRDPGIFEAMASKVYPTLIAQHNNASSLRIWVAGCASGEEAYSLAISLMEYLRSNNLPIKFQIFATDLSSVAIAKARSGIFKTASLQNIPAEYLQRYFTQTEDGYQISKFLRDTIVFAVHNVTRDPPFSNLDLVSCRNLLIYFNARLQARVLAMFHYSLRPNGYLVLGNSENVGEKFDLFRYIDNKNKIYARAPTSARPYADILVEQFYAQRAANGKDTTRGLKLDHEETIAKQADKLLLEQFAPVGFLVNENLRIIQFRGDTSFLLSPTPGSSSLTIMDMVRADLRYEIRSCISQALETGQTISKSVSMGTGDSVRHLILKAMPLNSKSLEGKYILLVVYDTTAAKPDDTKSFGLISIILRILKFFGVYKNPVADQSIDAMASFKEQLGQATRERDATNEQLRLTNEELLSANEELQSSNEELETAKEELQSSNEELHTVNDQVNTRNAELKVLHDNISNLLASIQTPVIMVDKSLKIRMVSPAAERLFNFIPSDVGRSIVDFNLGLDQVKLGELGQTVINTNQLLETQVTHRRAARFNLKVCPFKTKEQKVDGAVFSFVSIEALLVIDGSFKIQMINQSFLEHFKIAEKDLIGRNFLELDNSKWDNPQLRQLLTEVLSKRQTFENYEVVQKFPELGQRTLLLNAREIKGLNEQSELILSTCLFPNTYGSFIANIWTIIGRTQASDLCLGEQIS